MADSKISALPASTVPLAGTEAVPIVQGGTTKQVAVSDLTAGRLTSAANFANGYTAVVSAAGTTTLTASSTYVQKLSGSTTQTFKLPDATTIAAGTAYLFDNDSTGLLTVVDNASGAVTTVAAGGAQYVFLETAGTAAGSWGKYGLVPSITSGYIPYGNGTPSLNSSSALAFDGTTLTANNVSSAAATALVLKSGGTTGITVDTSGNTNLGTAGQLGTALLSVYRGNTTNYCATFRSDYAGTRDFIEFYATATSVGSITSNGTTTTYGTSSDYRLKENVQPMQNALAVVAKLKPCTYTWKVDGSDGQGFIAHELQEVVPDAVVGEKDATRIEQYEISPAVPATFDEEGNELTPAVEAVMGEREVPAYQGIDTSFLIATLTAAIQELKAEFDEYKASHP